MSVLIDFIQVESKLYEDEDGYRFRRSLGQASDYYSIIQVINKRHKESDQELNEALKDLEDFGEHVDIPVTEEKEIIKEQKFNRGYRAALLVHLEIESCYLFSKILLDKIALFLYDYFGQVNGVSLASHDKLVKYHEKYRNVKVLIYPDGFSENLKLLKESICDYRDKQISHLQSLVSQKVAFFDKDGQSRLMILPPTRPNKYAVVDGDISCDPEVRLDPPKSKKVIEILTAVDCYIQQIIELVKLNRDKSRFKLKSKVLDPKLEDA